MDPERKFERSECGNNPNITESRPAYLEKFRNIKETDREIRRAEIAIRNGRNVRKW